MNNILRFFFKFSTDFDNQEIIFILSFINDITQLPIGLRGKAKVLLDILILLISNLIHSTHMYKKNLYIAVSKVKKAKNYGPAK